MRSELLLDALVELMSRRRVDDGLARPLLEPDRQFLDSGALPRYCEGPGLSTARRKLRTTSRILSRASAAFNTVEPVAQSTARLPRLSAPHAADLSSLLWVALRSWSAMRPRMVLRRAAT
jgi:hypothetical protein